ncbi:MAG: hypothetical protein WA740_00355 [Candidatus Binataceae bacterium]
MESSQRKPAVAYQHRIKRDSRSRPGSLGRFAILLPWFSRHEVPMQIPLRSVAREFEELFHPYD